MFPLPEKPSVVILVDEQSRPCAIASNIDPNLNVVVTNDRSIFEDEAASKSFNSARLSQDPQSLSLEASKARHAAEAAALKMGKQ
jgi:hypothetical protein